MIDEKELAGYRNTDYAKDPILVEMMDTMEKLWKVARAARFWQKAIAGAPSVDAEIEMVKALDELKLTPGRPPGSVHD